MPNDSDHLDIDDAILARYLSGSCGPGELARVERWLAADPAHRDELAMLRTVWNPAPVPEADQDDQMWRWLATRMDRPLPRPKLIRNGYRPAASSWRSGLVAAGVVLAAGGALLFRFAGDTRPPEGTVSAVVPMRELVTSRGERATGNLPDGSRVILGPDSRLQIPATFAAARSARDVHLQGEAFFEVTHDAARPFRVHTPTGMAEDLGTEFVVTAYPETRATRVVVASGLVTLGSAAGAAKAGVRPVALTLKAGDLGRIGSDGAVILRQNVDVSAYVGWTKGELAFQEVPLPDVIVRLARWYDVDIQLADPALATRRFTAAFHDEPVSRVLRVLEIALDVRAERNGRLVILRPVRAAAAPQH
jgi:transmembrane sensor